MNNHYHFIGIGGIGMGALASLLLDKGFHVSGSDMRENQVTDRLKQKGARISLGHAAENIAGADVIIYSSAITPQNPEWVAAQEKQIPVRPRAKLLAELMEGQIGITVAGAHGKTTTTSMISRLLMDADFSPTTAVGGIVNSLSSNACLGSGKYFVAEVDESDGSFLYFSPDLSVITNIDFEHPDYYRHWDDIVEAYRTFIGQTRSDGFILAYGEDERLLQLVTESGRPFQTYGFSSHNNIVAKNLRFDHFCSKFDCVVEGEHKGEVVLSVPGQHNVANALASISLGLHLGIDFATIKNSLKNYLGVQRRFQLKGQVDDIWVVDDYAHHPTEIQKTLQAAQSFKQSNSGRNRIVTIFQPHRFSRVEAFMENFVASLTNTDYLIITDIYAASEKPIEGVSAEILCSKIQKVSDKPVRYVKKEDVVDSVLKIAQEGDLILTLGAGDINQIANALVDELRVKESKKQEVDMQEAEK